MVGTALSNSKVISGTNTVLAKMDFELRDGCGLLYPSKDSRTLTELPQCERPSQLVLLDGTWPQARTMVRDIPVLQSLPCFKLAPTEPGKYRIRLEPTDTSLSTVEAAVQALQAIEPETKCLDQLLVAFNTMVQNQLDHPNVGSDHYSGGPRSGHTINVPRTLAGPATNIVVAYGEAAYRQPDECRKGNASRAPLFWVAKRLGCPQTVGFSSTENHSQTILEFAEAIESDVELTDSFLNHLELSKEVLGQSISVGEFRDRWNEFLNDDDVLVVYNQGTIRLLQTIDCKTGDPLTLKSINFSQTSQRPMPGDVLENENLTWDTPNAHHGRAGRRLEKAIAIVKFLRSDILND